MYLIPMNRQSVWRWFHVRTLKYAEVMLHNHAKMFSLQCQLLYYSFCLRYFHKLYIHLRRISYRIEWFLFQLHSPKHARVIIIILLMICKAEFRSQGVNVYRLQEITICIDIEVNTAPFHITTLIAPVLKCTYMALAQLICALLSVL